MAAVIFDLDGTLVVSRKLWKFSGVALRAFEGLFFQAARSRGIGSIG
jgi:beta-phosphoglucomutase-like phosphatase (HAD superfamily)